MPMNTVGETAVDESSDMWRIRQKLMEDWYRGLIKEPDAADKLFQEYLPYAPFLAELQGSVLDVGGGFGLARQCLPLETPYLAIDPSRYWLEERRTPLFTLFPKLSEPFTFVQGLGEKLPFTADSFDAVLSFWTLNHTTDPDACILEMH